MSEQGVPVPHARRSHRRWLPFWGLQLAELVIAIVMVDVSVHVANSGLLVASAALFAVLAVSARGPLGIVRLCSQPLHVVLAIVTGVVVAVAPVLPALRPDVEGIIVLEFGAIGLIRLATFTDTSVAGPGSRKAGGAQPAIDATARVADPSGAGRKEAGTPGAGTTRPDAPAGAATARWAGRTVGQAGTTGKRAVEAYGPVAGASIRRGIRSVGRMVGRAGSGSPSGRPTDPAGPSHGPDTPGTVGE